MKKNLWRCRVGFILLCFQLLPVVPKARAETEAERVENRLLAPPDIKVAPGFRAKILVPPGELYDPLFMFVHDGAVWLTDDGGEIDRTGSRVVSVAADGRVTVMVPYTRTVPMISGGFWPTGVGSFAGQLIMFSQATTKFEGAFVNHIVQRLDPANNYSPSVICTLPNAGEIGNSIPGAGAEAVFGPEHSPFANRFFAATLLNGMVYQMNADGVCAPFADFHKFGTPAGIGFSGDGETMMVSTQADNKPGDPVSGLKIGGGLILRVSSGGKIDDPPFAKGLDAPLGIDIAPNDFGSYGGQAFIADAGPTTEIPVPMTQRVAADGKIYRVTSHGEIEVVATGFLNPAGVKFIGNKLWITDIAGDFIGGRRELPDGFIVEIEPK